MNDPLPAPVWQLVRDHVGARVAGLQAGLMGDSPARQSEARAQLAILRRSKADDPSDPAVWPITLGGARPELLGPPTGDEPTRAERAVHAALVTFALHMQSARSPRHVLGRRLGSAVRQLAGPEADEAVVKRFHTFATATAWPQRLHHLRGLVSLMRSHDVALDYGSLAADLYSAQTTDGLRRVRLQWGRDFHHVGAAARANNEELAAGSDPASASANTITESKES